MSEKFGIEREPHFLKCNCGSETFKIKITPFGECGTDHLFICAECGESEGGVINDPLEEWEDDSLA